MKKIFFVSLLLLASIAISAKSVPPGYVDLGLPSGTLWKVQNEPGLYMYQTAMYNFEANMPSRSQFTELLSYCSRSWREDECVLTGPNGKTISFRFDGMMDCNEESDNQGEDAYIWLSDKFESSNATYMGFNKKYKQCNSAYFAKCARASVHLVIPGNNVK